MSNQARQLADALAKHRNDILEQWTERQAQVVGRGVISSSDLARECAEFLDLLIQATATGSDTIDHSGFDAVRDFLATVSTSRAQQGFSPSETATFVFSLKEPLFRVLSEESGGNHAALSAYVWAATVVLDALGLYTTEVYIRRREEVIMQQQQDMLELSTPVVALWDGILALPMIGTLDSSRTQVVMETLLQRIVDTGADFAILDITGVPTVDTLTAQHLLKTVTAARLMGAECIISGIRPQIAQTVVHLGVNLGDIVTKATLADAFKVALARSGRKVVRGSGAAPGTQNAAGIRER
jgi:rsbT co-antagonist protein RsbR